MTPTDREQYEEAMSTTLCGQMRALGDAIRELGRVIDTELSRTWFARKIVIPVLQRIAR